MGEMQLHLYFGEGKGKTTAALGQALRSWGRGWRVLFVQLLKDADDPSGEVEAASRLEGRWRLLRSRLPCSTLKKPTPGERERLRRASGELFESALREMRSGRWEMVALDEALAAWKLGLLRVGDLLRARDAAREGKVQLLVMTGRWAPKTLLSKADVATEMVKVKHLYDRGGKARRGIDY